MKNYHQDLYFPLATNFTDKQSAMGNPLSVILANIYMAKIEKEVVTPLSPPLYTRYVDDIFCRKEKGESDELFQKLNQHHPNIKFSKESNLNAFLDTEIKLLDRTYPTNVYRRNKLPVNWNSKIPQKFKRNALNIDLHRAHKIASSFENELTILR